MLRNGRVVDRGGELLGILGSVGVQAWCVALRSCIVVMVVVGGGL